MRILAFALLFLAMACSRPERLPEGVLERERFTQVLLGATLIEARMGQEMGVSPAQVPPMPAYYAELFKDQGIDSATFRRSFDHYALRPLEMKAIYEDVVERLRVLKDEDLQGAALTKDTTLAVDSSSVRN